MCLYLVFVSLEPGKYEDGYSKVAKILRVLEESFIEWQQVKHEEGLIDDNAVAQYLLDCQKQLVTMQENSPPYPCFAKVNLLNRKSKL